MAKTTTAADLASHLGETLAAGSVVSAADRSRIHAGCWDHLLGSALERRGLRTEWRMVNGAYDGSLSVVPL